MRGERLLLVVTPAAALAAVALGLRLGARSPVRAALVYGAPISGAGTGLAWQIVAFDEDRGTREPVVRTELEVTAQGDDGQARWRGKTNDDGVAEVLLTLASPRGAMLEVRTGAGALLASGAVRESTALPRARASSAWARFARREGPLALDVAVLGQRVASGFPASIWVRATDATTHAPVGGATVETEAEAGLSLTTTNARTDARGWAHLVVTPMGYGVALILHARAQDGRAGDWAGALFVSPGAAQIVTRDRYAPGEQPVIDVVVPNVRMVAYVEIDDARGRAWGAALPLANSDGAMPRASVRAPNLAPGLYWAVTASDPAGAAELGPGTLARPFFVANTDEEALTFGTDAECTAPPELRAGPPSLGMCLALAAATAVPRWTALDGFAVQRAREDRRRTRGLSVALVAIGVAMALEALLLLRAAYTARVRLRAITIGQADALGAGIEDAGRVGIALLVALLGFALLAAFLVRAW